MVTRMSVLNGFFLAFTVLVFGIILVSVLDVIFRGLSKGDVLQEFVLATNNEGGGSKILRYFINSAVSYYLLTLSIIFLGGVYFENYVDSLVISKNMFSNVYSSLV